MAASIHLSGIVLLKIQVADGRDAEVRGEVRWEDKRRKIYGIQLLKTDLHWEDFVKYLRQDFDSLTVVKTKKVS